MVCLRFSFDPLPGIVTVCLHTFTVLSSLASTLPQFGGEYTCLLLDTYHGFSILGFLVCCPPGPSLWTRGKCRSYCHLHTYICVHSWHTSCHSSNLTYVLHQESKPMSTCSLLHLSMQMFSLTALWELFLFKHKTMKLIPSKSRQIKYFLILSRKNVPHTVL